MLGPSTAMTAFGGRRGFLFIDAFASLSSGLVPVHSSARSSLSSRDLHCDQSGLGKTPVVPPLLSLHVQARSRPVYSQPHQPRRRRLLHLPTHPRSLPSHSPSNASLHHQPALRDEQPGDGLRRDHRVSGRARCPLIRTHQADLQQSSSHVLIRSALLLCSYVYHPIHHTLSSQIR